MGGCGYNKSHGCFSISNPINLTVNNVKNVTFAPKKKGILRDIFKCDISISYSVVEFTVYSLLLYTLKAITLAVQASRVIQLCADPGIQGNYDVRKIQALL